MYIAEVRGCNSEKTVLKCDRCGGPAEIHLIDCSLPIGSAERALRYCPGCVPSSTNPRRFVVDRRQAYPLEERLKDIGSVGDVKTCPTCGAETTLIAKLANGQRFCHKCADTVCSTFMPHYVLTSEDVAWLRACGIDPEISRIESALKNEDKTETR